MGQMLEYIIMALRNIKMNRGRSFLTMLGIIIGVSSVILIMSIGNGAKSAMEDELTAFAGGQIYLYTNSNTDGEEPAITKEDREALRKLDGIKGAASVASMWTRVQTPKGNFEAIVEYAEPDYKYSRNPVMVHGRWYTWEEFEAGANVAVIPEADAIKMFGSTDVVGLTFEMDDGSEIKDMTIVGVRESPETTFVSVDYSGYLNISVPLTCDAYWADYQDFSSVYLFTQGGDLKALAQQAIQLLESRHDLIGQNAFLMEDFDSEMASVMQVLDMITIFIMLVAAISLLVGGIGVMNIMLVSVAERTREIGIRKALGARTRSVLVQFLAESAIITCIGGIIGIILGIAGAYGICMIPMVTFSPSVSVTTVVVATLFSCSVGIFFGIYPARKAARMNPIEALRRD